MGIGVKCKVAFVYRNMDRFSGQPCSVNFCSTEELLQNLTPGVTVFWSSTSQPDVKGNF